MKKVTLILMLFFVAVSVNVLAQEKMRTEFKTIKNDSGEWEELSYSNIGITYNPTKGFFKFGWFKNMILWKKPHNIKMRKEMI